MSRLTPEELRAAGLPVLYSPEDIEDMKILPGVKANWLKRKAGLGVVPCTRVGRTVMFSAADLTGIARICAQQAADQSPGTVTPISGRRPVARADEGARVLESRPPRRKGAA